MNAESKAVADVINLPTPVARRGIDEAQWRTLVNNLYPGADVNSILMVVDYCRARQLDPLKKPCHIVPMKVKDVRTGEYGWRDVVMPGIYEYRTTATRTGFYMGHSTPVYGELTTCYGREVPSSCSMTVYRWNTHASQKSEYPVTVWFEECCATKYIKDKNVHVLNDRWDRAPRQMLTKCAEAAALREAFPDELGGTHTEEELAGQVLDVTPTKGDQSGRPDTSEVDYTERDKWVGRIVDTLNADYPNDDEEYDKADAIRKIEADLQKNTELYVAVFDKLAAEKIISKANWNKTIKHVRPA